MYAGITTSMLLRILTDIGTLSHTDEYEQTEGPLSDFPRINIALSRTLYLEHTRTNTKMPTHAGT